MAEHDPTIRLESSPRNTRLRKLTRRGVMNGLGADRVFCRDAEENWHYDLVVVLWNDCSAKRYRIGSGGGGGWNYISTWIGWQ